MLHKNPQKLLLYFCGILLIFRWFPIYLKLSTTKVVPQLLPVLILPTGNAIYRDATKVHVFCSSLHIKQVLAGLYATTVRNTCIVGKAGMPTPIVSESSYEVREKKGKELA